MTEKTKSRDEAIAEFESDYMVHKIRLAEKAIKLYPKYTPEQIHSTLPDIEKRARRQAAQNLWHSRDSEIEAARAEQRKEDYIAVEKAKPQLIKDLVETARSEGRIEERKNCLIDVEDTAKKYSLNLLVNANYAAFILRLKEFWGLCEPSIEVARQSGMKTSEEIIEILFGKTTEDTLFSRANVLKLMELARQSVIQNGEDIGYEKGWKAGNQVANEVALAEIESLKQKIQGIDEYNAEMQAQMESEIKDLKQQLADANAKIKKYDECVGKLKEDILHARNDYELVERTSKNKRTINIANGGKTALNGILKTFDEIFPDAAKKREVKE